MNNTKQITKICENKEGASAVYGPQQVTENDLEQKEIRI